MKQFSASILSNRLIAESYYEMQFEWDDTAGVPKPGQFVTIRVNDSCIPLLRRPFAFSGYSAGKATVIYQKRGNATELLAAKEIHEKIDIIGPLGNFLSHSDQSRKALVVAGGIGLGPMAFGATTFINQKIQTAFIFGARSKELVPKGGELSSLKPIICTDDGSLGFKGTTVDYLKTLDKKEINQSILYCCGPTPMLKACHELAMENNTECIISAEAVMACGVGACMGCVIKVNYGSGYARICTEGPVFNSKDIKWT